MTVFVCTSSTNSARHKPAKFRQNHHIFLENVTFASLTFVQFYSDHPLDQTMGKFCSIEYREKCRSRRHNAHTLRTPLVQIYVGEGMGEGFGEAAITECVDKALSHVTFINITVTTRFLLQANGNISLLFHMSTHSRNWYRWPRGVAALS